MPWSFFANLQTKHNLRKLNEIYLINGLGGYLINGLGG